VGVNNKVYNIGNNSPKKLVEFIETSESCLRTTPVPGTNLLTYLRVVIPMAAAFGKWIIYKINLLLTYSYKSLKIKNT